MSPGLDMSGLVSCVGGDVLAIWVTACRGLLGRGLGKTTSATYAYG
jgi:hypothetical protein